MSYNRRQFLKTIVAGGMAASAQLPLSAFSPRNESLTILHTNDVHSHLDPLDASHPKFPNLGGFARRATLVDRLRKENTNLLLLDAGDIFQGTPYFNFFGGKPELKLMSDMQYDAATMGNHEFDNGLEHFAEQLNHAGFPFICTNYVFEGTVLEGKTSPWKIIEKGPFRIGLIGLGINPSGLVSPLNYEGMNWLDPAKSGEETATFLKETKECNLVIALSHLGLSSTPDRSESDKQVAAETSSIDLIIGGHSHIFLNKPEIVKNKAGRSVPIYQVGWGGIKLGQIDISFKNRKMTFAAAQHLVR